MVRVCRCHPCMVSTPMRLQAASMGYAFDHRGVRSIILGFRPRGSATLIRGLPIAVRYQDGGAEMHVRLKKNSQWIGFLLSVSAGLLAIGSVAVRADPAWLYLAIACAFAGMLAVCYHVVAMSRNLRRSYFRLRHEINERLRDEHVTLSRQGRPAQLPRGERTRASHRPRATHGSHLGGHGSGAPHAPHHSRMRADSQSMEESRDSVLA
jgi:hypothetical protein